MPSPPSVSPELGPLLFECARLLDDLAQAELNREAGRAVLTPALARLLPHLSVDGIRPTELARRVEVSKQAVGQALGDLARRGFVEMVEDPGDGRARLVRLTAEGVAAFAVGRGVLSFFEGELAGRVGRARLDALTQTLTRVHAVLAEWTTTTAPQRPPAPRPKAAAGRRRRPSRR